MPRKKPIDRVREICLALPEATEKEAWGEPTFRVRDKIFAQFEDNHHGSGIVGLWCKAPDGAQAFLVAADPARFYVPKYVGHKGWIGIRMDAAVDWPMVAALVRDSYRIIAPKRLAAMVAWPTDLQTRRKPRVLTWGFHKYPGSGLFSAEDCSPSIVGAEAFHFRVRDGNGWGHLALTTRDIRLLRL